MHKLLRFTALYWCSESTNEHMSADSIPYKFILCIVMPSCFMSEQIMKQINRHLDMNNVDLRFLGGV